MNSGPLLFLGLFAAMVCSWLGFIMEPQLQIGNLPQTNTVVVGDAISQTYPLTPSGDAHQGAEVYKANGCAACHTQFVRPAALGPDIAHNWGVRRSVAQDYLLQDTVLLGSQRIGPDLANFGRRADLNQILMRLYNPRSVVASSVMPSYKFLFETRKIEGTKSPEAVAFAEGFGPASGYEAIPRPEARALAAYLLNLRQDGYLFQAPPPPLPKTNSVPAAPAVKK
ncbi:MAG TPA: cbb3-type cytochrome c oxidase subunit II [Verrucomicrobiae bacterium]|jgi:cytochrome c oxidase cbb3-type subunit 2